VAGTAGLKLGINGYQNFGTGGSPSAAVAFLATGLSVTLATTWARYSIQLAIPSASGKTLGTNSDDCTVLQLWFSSGATNNAAGGNIGVQSGTIQLWGVQLEIGSGPGYPTPLEKLEYADDLRHCQRFYFAPSGLIFGSGYAAAAASLSAFAMRSFPVTMRAPPTVSGQSYANSVNNNAPAIQVAQTSYAIFTCTNAASGPFQLGVANDTYSADL
jgi:hypothetical protein